MGFSPRFSTEESDISRNNIVYVESINAFTNISGKIITLTAGTKYILTQSIDFQDFEFIVPAGGAVEITADNIISNTFTSSISGTTPLFSGDAGRLILRNIDITITTGQGKLFDINSTTATLPVVQIQNGRFIGGGDLGDIKGALTIIREAAFVNWSTGFVLDDNGLDENNGVAIIESNFSNIGETCLSVGGAQSFVTIQNCLAVPNNGGYFLNLDSGMTLTQSTTVPITVTNNVVSIEDGGAFLDPTSLQPTDIGIYFIGNTNVEDTNWVAEVGFENNSTVTSITNEDAYTDIGGTFVDGTLERFSSLNDILTYTGLDNITVIINAELSIRRQFGFGGRNIRAGIFINDTEVWSASTTMTGNINALPLSYVTSLSTDDTVQVKIKNEQNRNNIVVVDYKLKVNKV